MIRIPLYAYAVLLTACTSGIVEPIAPEAMTHGPAQEWAAEIVTNCSGVPVTAASVRWWRVDGIEGHPDAWGAWNPPGDVYLVRGAEANVRVSGHELLHHVLAGDWRHRDPAWEACGL